MIVIPQRLFADPNIKLLAREGQNAILIKSLTEDLLGREAYIANHAISIVLSGEQHIETYEGNDCTIRAGEMIFVPRGIYYVTDLKAGTAAFKSLLFYFDNDTIRQYVADISATEVRQNEAPEYLKLPQSEPIKGFTDGLLQIYRSVTLNPELLRLKTLELFHLMNTVVPDDWFAQFLFRLTLPAKRNIREFLEHNYGKPLSVADYAYLTGRSLTSFRRDFKAQFGTTPQNWIKDRRIKHAVDLLAEREMLVADLAAEAGYQNVSYFIREFRAVTGSSPKQYMLGQRRL